MAQSYHEALWQTSQVHSASYEAAAEDTLWTESIQFLAGSSVPPYSIPQGAYSEGHQDSRFPWVGPSVKHFCEDLRLAAAYRAASGCPASSRIS
jgi:hypothetical protein